MLSVWGGNGPCSLRKRSGRASRRCCLTVLRNSPGVSFAIVRMPHDVVCAWERGLSHRVLAPHAAHSTLSGTGSSSGRSELFAFVSGQWPRGPGRQPSQASRAAASPSPAAATPVSVGAADVARGDDGRTGCPVAATGSCRGARGAGAAHGRSGVAAEPRCPTADDHRLRSSPRKQRTRRARTDQHARNARCGTVRAAVYRRRSGARSATLHRGNG